MFFFGLTMFSTQSSLPTMLCSPLQSLLAARSRWELNVSSARNLDKVNTPMASLCSSTCAESADDSWTLDVNDYVNNYLFIRFTYEYIHRVCLKFWWFRVNISQLRNIFELRTLEIIPNAPLPHDDWRQLGVPTDSSITRRTTWLQAAGDLHVYMVPASWFGGWPCVFGRGSM